MLTKEEFERHFKSHSEKLEVRPSNGFIIISSKEGQVCPHYEISGCRIYNDRPIDCRLFPYVMHRFITRLNKTKIVYHTNSDCPEKNALFQHVPKAIARSLIMEFGKKVYGENKAITAQCENGALSRLRIRIEAALSRRINKIFLK